MSKAGSRYSQNCRAIPELRAGIVRALSRFPQVQAVYLFGSVATGTARDDSDIDVAVVTEKPLDTLEADMLAALVGEGFNNVDLVSLATEDIVLKFEAVRHHCRLFVREAFDPDSYYARIVREYADWTRLAEQRGTGLDRSGERSRHRPFARGSGAATRSSGPALNVGAGAIE